MSLFGGWILKQCSIGFTSTSDNTGPNRPDNSMLESDNVSLLDPVMLGNQQNHACGAESSDGA